MTTPTKKEMKKYKDYLKREAKKFKLTSEDLSNLYDFIYMIDDITFDTLKLNKMDKWLFNLQHRIEKVIIPELKAVKKI